MNNSTRLIFIVLPAPAAKLSARLNGYAQPAVPRETPPPPAAPSKPAPLWTWFIPNPTSRS